MEGHTSSPAEKVFGIAELAEHILLALAEAAIRDIDVDASDNRNDTKMHSSVKKHSDMQPLACLAAVQRVSCTFRDTITSSKKIRSLLQTSMNNGPESRALWLLEGVFGLPVVEKVEYGENSVLVWSNIKIEEIDTRNGRLAEQFHEFNGHHKASWRDVQIMRNPIGPVYVTIEAISYAKMRRVPGHRKWWVLGPGATLGELFDNYREVMQRTRKDPKELDDMD